MYVRKKEIVIIQEKEKGHKWVYWTFFSVVLFVAVYFPFFAPNLKYQVGTVASQIFFLIGGLCYFFGFLFIIWGIVTIFCGRSFNGVKLLIVGVLLIWIASYFAAPTINIGPHREEIPIGYY